MRNEITPKMYNKFKQSNLKKAKKTFSIKQKKKMKVLVMRLSV